MSYGYGQTKAPNTLNTSVSIAPPAPTPISPMQDARKALEYQVLTVHDRLGELERRLDLICVPSVPTADGANGSAVPTSSELRAFLDKQTFDLTQAIARIESLLGRLEL